MIIDREVLAAQARKLIEFHGDDWDQPHAIVTFHLDADGALAAGTWAAVSLDIPPGEIPGLMARIARETAEREPGRPAYAYGFLMEGFGMTEPPASAGEAERERFERARVTRTFHEQPDAVESASAWIADVHGRLWSCSMRRDTGEVREEFHGPGDPGVGGTFVKALLAVAAFRGAVSWGVAMGSVN